MAYLVKSSGEVVQYDHLPGLDEAQRMVGGYVEPVYPRLSPSVVLLVDEDGLRKQKELNLHASKLYGGPIVGDVFVMNRNEAKKGGWL